MVRSQPIMNILALPHWARMPTNNVSQIRLAHYRASVSFANIDHFNAYQAFIERNAFCRENWEDVCKLPTELYQAMLEIEAKVRRRASWTRARQSSNNAPTQTIPFETP